MKRCELLALGHCIHLPLILVACVSSGQSYNIGLPVAPIFCDVIDTAMTGDPIAFWGFLNFYQKSTRLIAPGVQYVYLYLITRVW